MVVQHNLTAMNSNRMLGITTSAQDGVSAVQTAEGALTEVHSMLQRMNELANQASNGTNSASDRDAIQAEIDQLTTEIDRVSETTKINETYLLKGNADGTTKTNTINAHDAGLDGKLVDNGNGTSTFTAKSLAVGDKVSIAGKEYKIGKSADFADYAKKGEAAVTPAKAGDSVTSNGVTTTIVAKVTTADATDTTATKLGALLNADASWKAGDKITEADGTVWTYTTTYKDSTDITTGSQKGFYKTDADGKFTYKATANTTDLVKDGTKFTLDAANTVLKAKNVDGVTVVDDLGKNEASIVGTVDDVTNLQNSIKAGDTVSVGGTTKTVTAETPKTLDEIEKDTKLDTVGSKVSIGSKEYTIQTSTDLDKNQITKDDFIAMIKDGDKVGIGAAAGAKDYYTALVKASDDDSITLDEAYSKMAEELKTASSIGTDTAATVKNNGNGTFEITQGSVKVKDALSFSLHVGADADMTNKINVDIESMSAAGLGVKGINVSDNNGVAATYAIDAIADAISKVSSQRSALGAVQNRLEHTISNLDNVVENTTAAESRIRDTDMAEEMVNYSKNNILAQAGQSMLAQANQSNQGVLSLLQ